MADLKNLYFAGPSYFAVHTPVRSKICLIAFLNLITFRLLLNPPRQRMHKKITIYDLERNCIFAQT